eukprot:11011144-Karenia_brevis.AAC.1
MHGLHAWLKCARKACTSIGPGPRAKAQLGLLIITLSRTNRLRGVEHGGSRGGGDPDGSASIPSSKS